MAITGSADSNLVAKWDERLKSCQQARINFERQWHENMAFFYGRQWIATTKNPSGQGFSIAEAPTADRWRVRHTANRILRIVRKELTNLTKEEPQFYCVPKSTEEKDRLAAMAGDSIAEYLMRTKYFNRRRREATLWMLLCGTAFIKNYYDPTQPDIDGLPGKIDFEPVTAFHLFVPNLQATELEAQDYVIHARTVSPEKVYNTYGVELPPGTDASSTIIDSRFISGIGIKQGNNEKQCYIKEVYVKPCKDYPNGCFFVYGENKILYVYEQSSNPMDELGSDPSMGADPMAQLSGGSGIDQELMDLFQKPQPPGYPNPEEQQRNSSYQNEGVTDSKGQPVGNKEYPRVDGDPKLNYEHAYPYRHAHFPFAKIDHIPTGMFYSESVIKSLIPSQKEYNRTRSIMLENRNLAGKPQWSYVAGSFDPRKFNSKPGLLLPINMGFDPPRPLDQPPLPASIPQELQFTIQDMDDISAQTEVSKGQTPPGVEAASAIAYLAEENDTILHASVSSIEEAVQETGVQILANVYDYWPAERIVRMTSKNQYMEVREFKAGDLNPVMDFRVESNSMAPRSLAAKQAFITELMKMGAIDPTRALRYLQMSETNKLYDELMLDNRQATRENVYMSQGQKLTKPQPGAQMQIDPMTGQPMPPQNKQEQMLDPTTSEPIIDPQTGQPQMYDITVNGYDDHEVHIQEHQAFQKSQEYELLPPEIQQIVQDHVDEHKMELLKERNAAQADEMAKPGAESAASPRLEGQNGSSYTGNNSGPGAAAGAAVAAANNGAG